MKQTTASANLDLDESTCVYGAGVLLKHVNDLAEEIEGIRSGSRNIEYIHDARVASRRLRAALPLFQDCLPHKKSQKWLKRLHKVTRRLGEARDSDVQIEVLDKFKKNTAEKEYRTGINRLMLRLRQQREKIQQPVEHAMDQLVKDETLNEMHDYLKPLKDREEQVYLYTPTLYQHSFQTIHQRLEAFLDYEPVIFDPENKDELHQMRIEAKWLRYTMETFGPLYANELKPFLKAIREVQDLLGDIHDCDVWLEFLPEFLDQERQRTREYFGHEAPMRRIAPGVHYFQQDRQQKRDETYQTFLTRWQQWQAEDLWPQLRKTIQVPFLQPENIYPPLKDASQTETDSQATSQAENDQA